MYCVDSIEEGIVALIDEDENRTQIMLSELPESVKEGDVLRSIDGKYEICAEETRQRAQRMAEKLNKILNMRRL